jgi:hypothetical protein
MGFDDASMSDGMNDIAGDLSAEVGAEETPAPSERRTKHREDRASGSQSAAKPSTGEPEDAQTETGDGLTRGVAVSSPSGKDKDEKPKALAFNADGKPQEEHTPGDFEYFKERWGLYKPTISNVTAAAYKACLWKSHKAPVGHVFTVSQALVNHISAVTVHVC